MDINAFLTAESLQSNASTLTGTGNGKNGLFAAAPGANFIDLIISHIEQNEMTQVSETLVSEEDLIKQISDQLNLIIENAEQEGVDVEATLGAIAEEINEETGLEFTVQDLLAIANAEDLTAELANAQLLQAEAQLMALLKVTATSSKQQNTKNIEELKTDTNKNSSTFQDFVNHLLQGIPASSRPEVLEISTEDVQNVLENLEFDPESSEAIPALIATDLSPKELNKLINDIREQTEDGQSLVIGMVKIHPAEEQPVFVPAAILMPQQRLQQMAEIDQSAIANDEDMDLLASQLNDLVIGAGENSPTPIHKIANPAAANPLTGGAPQTLGDILRMMQQEAQGQNNGSTGLTDKGAALDTDANPADTDVSAGDLKTSKGTHPTINLTSYASGEIGFDTVNFSDFLNGSMDFFQTGGAAPSATISGPGSVAGLVTQVQHAAMAHPSTHKVAATLTKAAASGDTQNITINMTPPELGRVQVQLEFSADNKKVKTHITVEKAETYALLQRDAHLLERALQDSGVDMGGADLSFELSQDGSLFDQNPEGQGQNDSGGSGGAGAAAGEEELEIIETTMDWYVDPSTGLTHYDILA